MAKRYDPIMCMMVDEPTKAQDESYIVRGRKYKVVKRDGDNVTVLGPDGKVTKMDIDFLMSEGKKVHDANTLYETFAHGNSKHAGVLEMNGKVKVVVWNEGDNPRTGKVTVIGEDTPANRSKAKSMLDSASTLDKAIKVCDASTGHKVVVFVENYLRSIGKNNSTGKYDKIVQGVKSLLSQSLLDDEGLKKAAEHEADRLLKKYNL